MTGFYFAVRLRRSMVCLLFDKAVVLSMKSITETNSGKLISLISADLFTMERGLGQFPILFASPFINIVGCYIISTMVEIKYTAIIIGFWLITMLI